jgi:hypothetical protein
LKEFEICIGGICFKATLLEEVAPNTCKAYWDSMPIEDEAYHGKLAGSEIYSTFQRPIAKIEPENKHLLCELKPGDISGSGGGFAIFYGEVSPEPYEENIFARVVDKEELEKLKKAGHRLWFKPGVKIVMRKIEV